MKNIIISTTLILLSIVTKSQVTGTFTDVRDGIQYKTVTIGAHTWMAENLKYLPKVDSVKVGSDTIPHYYVYGYNGNKVTEAKATDNYKTYGVLYNWSAVMAGSPSTKAAISKVQGVCPKGWHVPSHEEWNVLRTNYKGFKEVGTAHWQAPNGEALNTTKFTALPSGFRSESESSFFDLGINGNWWTSTEYDSGYAFLFYMNNENANVMDDNYVKATGYAVRCIKN